MQHVDNMEAYSDTEQFSGGETALNMLYELLQSEQTPDQKSSDQISYCPPLQSKNLTLQDSQDAVHLQSPSLCHQQMFPLSPQTKQTSLPPYTKQDSCVAKAPLSPQQKSLNTSLAPQTEQDSHVAMAPPSLQQKSLNASNQKVNDHDVSTHPTPQLKSLSKQKVLQQTGKQTGKRETTTLKRRKKSAQMNMKAQRASFYSRQSNAHQFTIKEVIDLDKCSSPSKLPADSPIWISNEHMKLRQRHRESLLSGQWLSDDIIDAAQSLLKLKSNVDGLQSVCATRTLSLDVQQSDFVQILHNGFNHWLTISTIGAENSGEVYVYDSMYCNTTPEVKKIVAALLFTRQPKITLIFVDVQMQCGAQDCGLFAIAFATTLCFGKQPGQLTFNQDEMWAHLLYCLEKQEMSMFPVKRERRSGYRMTVKGVTSYPVFCTCRLPSLPNVTMIQCTTCKVWYHVGACVKVWDKKALTNPKVNWNCPECPGQNIDIPAKS